MCVVMSLQVRLLRSIPPTSLRLGVAVVAVVVAVMVVVVAVAGYALHQSLRLNSHVGDIYVVAMPYLNQPS